MPRCLTLLLLTLGALNAAIWPDQLGPYKRNSSSAIDISPDDRARLDEYGFVSGEQADYGPFRVTATKFKDSTGAYARSLERPATLVGNYVITCAGKCPGNLASLAEALPGVSHASLPSLSGYFPETGRISNSDRYILGASSLQAFAPQIPASAVAFQFGTEGQIARYRTPHGEESLAVFAYPTPQMARQQATEFEKLAGAMVKRSGPLVAVVPVVHDASQAAALFSRVNYHASVALDEKPPIVIKPQSVGKMMIAIFMLTGIVLCFCVLSGLAFAGFKMLSRRRGPKGAQDPMILLHLGDR